MLRRRLMLGLLAVATLSLLLAGVTPAFAAYQHMGEIDSGYFLTVHPEIKGTKIDSCTLCHTGGTDIWSGKPAKVGSCQWCHLSQVYGYSGAGEITKTLNPYGKAYYDAGRSVAAVRAIESLDSDGDGYKNSLEIDKIRYPGDATDDPTKVPASYRIYTIAQLKAMPKHTQFLAMNASKSDDSYSLYSGVTMEELLSRSGVLASATGLTVFAPDGWLQFHPMEPSAVPTSNVYPVRWTYPAGTFYYDAVADLALNPTGGWVNYSSPAAAGRLNGSAIVNPQGLKLLVAYARDSKDMTAGVIGKTLKLDGEGPLRIVPPQSVPGPMDQRSTNSSSTLIWPYVNSWDHNAGASTRSTTMIRVEPLPPGTTDINVLEAGFNYVDQGKIIVYGALEPMASTVTLNRSRGWVKKGNAFELSGVVNTGIVGDNVVVEVKRPRSGRWSYSSARGIYAMTADGGGKWWYRYKPNARGSFTFRARFAGDVSRKAAVSRTMTVISK
jgi:hypothetical protein